MGASKLVVIGGSILVLAAACSAGAGCGGSGSGADPLSGPEGGVPPEAGDGATSGDGSTGGKSVPVTAPAGAGTSFCEKTIGASLRQMEGCCTPDDKATPLYGFSQSFGGAFVKECGSRFEGSIAKGRLRYRPDLMSACVAAFDAIYKPGNCTSITEPFPGASVGTCIDAFVGTGGSGSPCAGDRECDDGLTCVGHGDGVEGTCRTPPPLGSACGEAPRDADSKITYTELFGNHPPCVPGAACSSSSHTCVAGGPGAKCSKESDCEGVLSCVRNVCATSRVAAGGVCDASNDCKTGLYCLKAQAGNQCTPRKTVGGTCAGVFSGECIGRCEMSDGGAAGSCVSYCGSR